jgi:integrase
MANATNRKCNFTDAWVKCVAPPTKGFAYHYDTREHGLALRVLANGNRFFVIRYRSKGRERYFSIGRAGDHDWRVKAARDKANRIKAGVQAGSDPLDERKAERVAERQSKSVADLCDQYIEGCLPEKKASTQRDYFNAIKRDILPALGKTRISDLTMKDVKSFHQQKSKIAPHRADFCIVLLQAMFTQAVDWEWLDKNPIRIQGKRSKIGVKLHPENKRERYLADKELGRLLQALAEHEDIQATAIIRILLYCGSRYGETIAARWEDFDLSKGEWRKPASTTKSGKLHRVPLSNAARQVLRSLRSDANRSLYQLEKEINDANDEKRPGLEKYKNRVENWVFPARKSEIGHRVEIRKNWIALCKAAHMLSEGKPTIRIHDLRHSYASMLINQGTPLFVVGKLLGHSDSRVTERYAHLMDDTLRVATETVAKVIAIKKVTRR